MAARGPTLQSLNLPQDICQTSVIPREAGIFGIGYETLSGYLRGAVRIGAREGAAEVASAVKSAPRDKTAGSSCLGGEDPAAVEAVRDAMDQRTGARSDAADSVS